MTLLITVLTERTIYQSADYRLTDVDTGKVISNTSTKLITLQYGDWDGFVAYTGIGRWEKRRGTSVDTSEFVLQWLEGLYPATPADVAGRICDMGSTLLSAVEASPERKRLTFILAAFVAGTPQVTVISNFEDCSGRNDAKAEPQFTISSMQFVGRPRIVVSGWKSAVSRQERRLRERIVSGLSDDPGRIRRMLAKMNAEAAACAAAHQMISPECSVVSVRADGRGAYDVDGAMNMHGIMMGMRMPDVRELARRLGFGVRVKQMAFASSKPCIPYEECRPRTITPADAGEYVVREVKHEDFASCRALDVSEAGVVLGDGSPRGRPADHVLWTAPIEGEPKACGFIAQPGGINDAGEVAANARMSDGSEHAVRWRKEALIDLGCFRGQNSGAAAINATGLIVGWVCADDSVGRGNHNHLPAAWSLEKIHVLEDFGCDWGQAVDVNRIGAVLVVGYVGHKCRAILWDPLAGTTEVIGGITGIYPMAINANGVVLGKVSDGEGRSVACLARLGQRWSRLGTAPGLYATAMNDAGDVVGAAARDGFEQPWLRRASGEILWLPYFAHHGCRPAAINGSGGIVGTGTTDHGTHALIWARSLP